MEHSEKTTCWSIFRCDCEDSPSEHVHCGCSSCNGTAVSRATAFRHRTREYHLSAYSGPPGSTVHLQEHLEEGHEQNSMDMESISNENLHAADHEMLDSLDSSPNVFDSDIPEEAESTDAGDSNGPTRELKEKIVGAILDALKLQLELKISNIGFDHILDWGKKIFSMGCSDQYEYLWPTCWKDAEQLLHSVGYRDAKKYIICLDESHRCHFGILSSDDELCPHCNKTGTIPYYYLGLGPKFNLWTSDPVFCKKMSHWFEKDHWLKPENQDGWGFETKKEVWDGKRFAELQWFWNPDEQWQLPAKCESCGGVISVQDIETSPDGGDGQKLVMCPSCTATFAHTIQRVHGDPRNLAYIVHWDGFQPFDDKYNHGSGAIEVQIANMHKGDRQKQSEIFVLGFVPAYLLPKGRPVALDPFLSPLIDDIEDGFINGIEVNNYAFSLPHFPSGPARLRHLILCVTGDHVAICEMCKAIFCGKNPCLRCKCGSTLDPNRNHYYYGGYRKAAKYPWPKRNIDDELEILQRIEDEERKTVAQTMAKNSGFTGLSALHRLHALYGFDYRRDCVFDVMHLVALGVVRNHLSFLLDNELVDQCVLQERLARVPWTADFLSSRYPVKLSRIGFWKAKEFQKFAFPISEVVLGGLLSEEHFEAWECLARVVEFLYSQGRNGWTVDSTAVFHRTVLRYNVLLSSCHVVNHNLTHIHEDVLNFGSSDNYWCYNFERAVGRYIAISTNHKNIELTFARAELWRKVLKVRTSLKAQENGSEVTICYPVKAHYGSLATLEHAIEHMNEEGNCMAKTNGILVGALKPVHLTDEVQKNSILAHLSHDQRITAECISDVAQECRSIYFSNANRNGGMFFRLGENAIFTSVSSNEEKIFTLTKLLRIKVNNDYHLYAVGECFQPLMHGSEKAIHLWGKGALVRPSGVEFTVPSSSIKRKVMLFPDPGNLLDPSTYISIDYQRPNFPVTSVIVPIYPEVADMILVKGDDPEPWRALVLNVQMRIRTVQVHFYVPHPRWGRQSGLWVREGTRSQPVHFKSIVGICAGTWQGSARSVFKET